MGNFKGHPNYECERLPSRDAFGIRHYAGLVIYDASQFLEKNRDTMPLDLLEVFNTSVFELIRELFDTPDAKRPYACSLPTLATARRGPTDQVLSIPFAAPGRMRQEPKRDQHGAPPHAHSWQQLQGNHFSLAITTVSYPCR